MFVILQTIDSWLAYAPVKNNPEDAAKVVQICRERIHLGLGVLYETFQCIDLKDSSNF